MCPELIIRSHENCDRLMQIDLSSRVILNPSDFPFRLLNSQRQLEIKKKEEDEEEEEEEEESVLLF